MGVFARLLRKSKATEEAATAAQAGTEPGGTDAAGTAEEAAATKTPDADRAEGAAVEPEADEAGAVGDAASDGTEIPQQQSAAQAADNEAGEGART
ncbi:hypothetical protein [Streptomyces sp. NPDC005209]|uniref:hypothetical protein n=1 Tax=Streptomyces sp. NPDC005209 TaxID=3156715 RepID=UPI0033AB688D